MNHSLIHVFNVSNSNDFFYLQTCECGWKSECHLSQIETEAEYLRHVIAAHTQGVIMPTWLQALLEQFKDVKIDVPGLLADAEFKELAPRLVLLVLRHVLPPNPPAV